MNQITAAIIENIIQRAAESGIKFALYLAFILRYICDH